MENAVGISYQNMQINYPVGDGKGKEVQQYYNKWSGTYNQDMANLNYKSPQFVAEYMMNGVVVNESSSVLDVGSGTGLLGYYLREFGFKGEITALDFAISMLSRVPRNVYKEFIEHEVTPTTSLPLDGKAYDVTTAVGIFAPNQVKAECVQQLIDSTKNKGHIIFTTREQYSDAPDYMMRLRKIFEENEGKAIWKKIDERKFHQYSTTHESSQNITGILLVYQKL